jgi:transitional endoplasmic reticulum ATPase
MERERIKQDALEAGAMVEDEVEDDKDLVPEILPKHFEEAVRNARRSVSDRDLAQYSSFAQNLQQARANITTGGGSLAGFQFPQRGDRHQAGPSAPAFAAQEEDEDDLYS